MDDPALPPVALTPLGVAIDQRAAEHPDSPALFVGDLVRTWGELARRTNRLARVMASLGVSEGDMVSVGLPNGFAFYETVIAAWKLGAVPQPISHRLPKPEIDAIVELANPSLVVGLDPGGDRPWLPRGFEPSSSLSDEPLPSKTSPSWKAPTSGGSTGRPKLIVAADPGYAEKVTVIAPLLDIRPGGVFLLTAPLYHNAPFQFSLINLLLGGPVVIMERFDAAETLALVERHRATYIYVVPTMMSRILKLPRQQRLERDVSSLQVVLHMAAPCPPHVKEAWIDWVGAGKVMEIYAGTEAVSSTKITGAEWLDHVGSVGRVISGEMRIADNAGTPLPPGELGEVWMRSPEGVTTYRYIGAIAEVNDGWQTHGDMGWFDEDGYLYLADRKSDMILVGGANVYPAEVEAALDGYPQVMSSCVIGLPDDDYGNVVHAIVETTGELDDGSLRAYLAERLAPYKLPRTFERSATPLRDEAGKVRRNALRAERLPQNSKQGREDASRNPEPLDRASDSIYAPGALDDQILAVDIGASTIKFGVVDEHGQLAGKAQRIATPYPCTPETLIRAVAREIERSDCARIGIGFPGELVNGRVIAPGNLSRSGGVTTDINAEIHEKWLNFDLEGALREVCHRDIRVVNDAALAALGCCSGVGRELTFTLGSGFGISLMVDGVIVRIRDVGAELFQGGETFDELLGEPSRSRDERRWGQLMLQAIEAFVIEFKADMVHIGGGNARYVDTDVFHNAHYRVELNGNDETLSGAARLFPSRRSNTRSRPTADIIHSPRFRESL